MCDKVKTIQREAYQCTKCGKVYLDKQLAELCCKEYFCEKCGKKTYRYWLLCDECSEQKRFEKAEKISYKEYLSKYSWSWIYDGSDYYSDLEELQEMYEYDDKKLPEYVYACDQERVELNIESDIEMTECDCGLEDFTFDNTEKLIKFVNEWNKENGQDYYCYNDKLIILLTEEDFK